MTQLAQDKNCFCHTCNKGFNSLGIASHRSIHRRKGENCKITYSNGKTVTHLFADDAESKEGIPPKDLHP